MANNWSSGDAWFLATVALFESKGPADLTSIIATGDYLNRAIFNRDEIERAVARLLSAGLLHVEEGGSFAATDEGANLWNRSPRKQPLNRMIWLEAALKRFDFDPDCNWHLDPSAYRDAVAEYRARFAAAYERVTEQPFPPT